MIGKNFTFVLAAVSAFVVLAPAASANSIEGTTVIATSSFTGGTAQQFTFDDIAGAATQSSLNLGAGADDSIQLVAGTPNGDHTRNQLIIKFGDDLFDVADYIDFTLKLSGQTFNGNFSALIVADDVQIPSGSVNGNLLSFQMTNLDQIAGNGGTVEFIFDAEPEAPEPATLSLLAFGFAGLFYKIRRRA